MRRFNKDMIAPQREQLGMNEIRDDIIPKEMDGVLSGHRSGSYHDASSDCGDSDKSGVFAIPQGKVGAVKNRKDHY